MRKGLIRILVVIICLVFCLTSFGAGPSDADKAKTLASLQKVDGFPLYTMDYYGDYAVDEYMKEGSKNSYELIQFLLKYHLISENNVLNKPQNAGCTSFMARNSENEILYGRNFDLQGENIPLLLRTQPSIGYASISMVNLRNLRGKTGDSQKDFEAIWSNIFAAPYMITDGLNEYGVAISTLDVPNRDSSEQDPSKVTIWRWAVSRLVLDHAKNLDEAINLLREFNINVIIGNTGGHYLIADAAGNSAVIEVVDGTLQVIINDPMPWPNQKPWQVASNFLLSTGFGGGFDRYSKAVQTLISRGGVLSQAEAMDLLRSVSQSSERSRTFWSAVYNLHTKEVNLVIERQYDKVLKFKL